MGLERKTIGQQLKSDGFDDDFVIDIVRIAGAIYNAGGHSIATRDLFFDIGKGDAFYVATKGRDALRVLEERGYVAFDQRNGKYTLTKKAIEGFEVN